MGTRTLAQTISAELILTSLSCNTDSNPLADGSNNTSIKLSFELGQTFQCGETIGVAMADVYEGDGVNPIASTMLECRDPVDPDDQSVVEGELVVPSGNERRVIIRVFDPNGGLTLVGATGPTVNVVSNASVVVEIDLTTDVILAVINGSGTPGSSFNSVPLFLANVRLVNRLECIVTYNRDVLTPVGVSSLIDGAVVTSDAEGSFIFVSVDAREAGGITPGVGPIVDILFDVNEDASPGRIDLNLQISGQFGPSRAFDGAFRVTR